MTVEDNWETEILIFYLFLLVISIFKRLDESSINDRRGFLNKSLNCLKFDKIK